MTSVILNSSLQFKNGQTAWSLETYFVITKRIAIDITDHSENSLP